MDRETQGTVVAVFRQWWLRINTKSLRTQGLEDSIFPHVIKVRYTVEGKDYFKRKWIPAGQPVPVVGTTLAVLYRSDKPGKAKVF